MYTPQQFIDKYTKELQDETNKYDIQVNKLGLIGYFLNVVGNVQYDAKEYYDKLFKESFLATARDDSNLYMHGSFYKYKPDLATPAVADGNFSFDFTLMPKKPADVQKREVIFENIAFEIDGFNFVSQTTYKFVEENDTYYGMCYLSDGNIQYISASSKNIIVPFYEVSQISIEDRIYEVPNYSYGEYYPINVDSGNQYFSNIFAYLRLLSRNYGEGEWSVFDISRLKYYESGYSEAVFLQTLGERKYLIELGSGEHGLYVPESTLMLLFEKTFGSRGNINVETNLNLSDGNTTVKQYDANGDFDAISMTVLPLLQVEFKYSKGGRDPLSGLELKEDIIKHVQSRDNLINQHDFYNITSKQVTDFKYLFKKSSFMDNIFYLHGVLRDKYQRPVKTTNHTFTLLETEDRPTGVTIFDSDVTGNSLPSGTYTYYITASDGFVCSWFSDPRTINTTNNTVNISWDSYSNTLYYYVLTRPDENDLYECWRTTTPEFIDDGIYDSRYIGRVSLNSFTNNNIIFQPEQEINGSRFISPFLYKYNSRMRWYDGFIVHDQFVLYPRLKNKNDQYTVPIFFFQIVYDYAQGQSYVYVKSMESITDYQFTLTSDQLDIYNEPMEYIDDNTFRWIYDINEGLIFKQFDLEVNVKDSSNNNIVEIYSKNIVLISNIKDQLKLLQYQNSVTNLPVIDKSIFDSNYEFYKNKVTSFILDNDVYGNRLTTDEIQFRFLNTYRIDQDVLKYFLIQNYDQFSIQFPLKLQVNVYIDQYYVNNNTVDLGSEKDSIYSELAQTLQTKYTGVDIKLYNSMIVDLVHTHPYAKSVNVTITDSLGTVIPNGLESVSDNDLYERIETDEDIPVDQRKLYVLSLTPPYYHWDVDDIHLRFLFS